MPTDPRELREIYGIITCISFFVILFMTKYMLIFIDNQRMRDALLHLFPDIRCKFDGFFFRLFGFRSQLTLHRGRLGSMTLYVSFSGKPNPSQSLSRKDRIFEATFRPGELVGKAPVHLFDGKKYMEIETDSPALEKNLANDDGLWGVLYKSYLNLGFVSSVCLNKNGIEVRCFLGARIVDKNNITAFADHCVKACEQALKAAAREGIQLNAPNPFQDFQGAPGISHNPELEARSDEALYNSLDGSSNENGKNDELKLFL